MARAGKRPGEAEGLLGSASPFEQEVLLIEREQLQDGGVPPPLWTWLLLTAAVSAAAAPCACACALRLASQLLYRCLARLLCAAQGQATCSP